MHPNFYHWHNRVELKPDTAILKARWDAATRFAEELTGDVACSLIHLALFGTATSAFAKRFSEALVLVELTFPPEDNLELLRVMATAALYSQMESASIEADVVALGLQAAAFLPDRIQPVCKELILCTANYLAKESERMRPIPEKNMAEDFQLLQDATKEDDWEENSEAHKLIGRALLQLGETMKCIAEENQYVWWLLSRRSSLLNSRREKLGLKEYALAAAHEAAERVTLLPPPASVESLIDEVLTHCSKPSNAAIALIDLVEAASLDHLDPLASGTHYLCPVSSLLETRRAGESVNDAALQKLLLPAKLKMPPNKAAIQLFRELMFFRALTKLS
jgi:hypothetical protein